MNEKNKELMVEEMFAVGAHFGYSKSKRHPSTKNFIFTNKNGLDIINLEKTSDSIFEAQEKIKEIISKGKKIILVATKHEIKDLIPEISGKNTAEKNIFYVNNRWIGGTLTNFSEIKKRIFKLIKLIDESETGELEKYTKKEQLKISKEIEKLKKYYSGLTGIKEKPAALVVVDAKEEEISVKEAQDLNIEVIAICNTDNNIKNIKLPIVANDRSRDTIKYILKEILN